MFFDKTTNLFHRTQNEACSLLEVSDDVFHRAVDVRDVLPFEIIDAETIEVAPDAAHDTWQNGAWVLNDDKKAQLEAAQRLQRHANVAAHIERIFTDKTHQIKQIATDKVGSPEYIDTQMQVYETMYQNAKNGYYDAATNAAIITANESSKRFVAGIVLAMNELRSQLQVANDAGIDITAKLAVLDALKLTKTSVTPEAIGAFMSKLGS